MRYSKKTAMHKDMVFFFTKKISDRYITETLTNRVNSKKEETMLRTKEQRRTCAKYSAHDENGNVHCRECPLVVDLDGFMCRAWTHYDRH